MAQSPANRPRKQPKKCQFEAAKTGNNGVDKKEIGASSGGSQHSRESMWLDCTISSSTHDNGSECARKNLLTLVSKCTGTEEAVSVLSDHGLGQKTARPDLDTPRQNVGNGLHYRHQFQAHTRSNNLSTSVGNSFWSPQTSPNSPSRRHKTPSFLPKSHAENQMRMKRKWTLVHVFRSLLLPGAALYFLVVLRGTQIVLQQQKENDGKTDPSHEHLSDYFSSTHFPASFANNLGLQRYLRPGGSLLRDSLVPFLHEAMHESADLVTQAVAERRSMRKKRTQPPFPQPETSSPCYYEIVPIEKRTLSRPTNTQPTTKDSSVVSQLADSTQLCGQQAKQARVNDPNSFLGKDALLNTNARVLITGIISNPLAFHLALTLKDRCGVDVLIGIDPMLPNTIQDRMRYMEQMKILSTNLPKLVQPVLVPLIGLDPRVKKSKKAKSEQPIMLPVTGELSLTTAFEPTHIVHLSASSYQNPLSTNIPQSLVALSRPQSPYQTNREDPYEPSIFHIRSSMMALEQILASTVVGLGEGGKQNLPHLTYTSSTPGPAIFPLMEDSVLHFSKVADDVMADSYSSLFGTYSVSVRYPPNSVYGPWDMENSAMNRVFQGAIKGNHRVVEKPIDGDGGRPSRKHQDILYVKDAVEAILAAMQYREREATGFELVSNAVISLSTVASTAGSLLAPSTSSFNSPLSVASVEPNKRTKQKLEWSPRTTPLHGIVKTLAWHLDRAHPYGPAFEKVSSSIAPPLGTGDDLLKRNSVPACAASDLACHTARSFLPCVSECSIRTHCETSIFDSVQDLARDMTEGCDAVLYTQSLGQDVKDLKLQAQFEDDAEPAICNLAFVADRSPLVRAVIGKIPAEEFDRLGVTAGSRIEEKLKALNGRLLYRGWILIWVESAEPVSLADSSLLKLSPGRMFSRDVLYAVFVEENFTVSPTTDDVRFLISQMDRSEIKQKNIWRRVKKDEHSKAKKVKFAIAGQPEKRASILVSQLKFKISDRGRIPQETKISIMDAVRFMRFEIGSDPMRLKESPKIKYQKDFYRRIPTYVNGKDLRDNYEPVYKYELKHWVRTRWVVHDLTLEESRDLRCDWYQEHVDWASEIDQLSFAAVMARRILHRRMALLEPDDRSSKVKKLVIPNYMDITDNNEWVAMTSEQNSRNFLRHDYVNGLVRHRLDKEESGNNGYGLEGSAAHAHHGRKQDVGLYVRIMSDRIMSLSRKAWARYRAEVLQSGGAPRQDLSATS